MEKLFVTLAMSCGGLMPTFACTGISLTSKDGSLIQARTIEGAQMELPSGYVVIPRGQKLVSFTPEDADGMRFKARYGVLGLTVVRKEFIAEGINEKGLAAGLFFFPHYGSYAPFNPSERKTTVGDLQLVQWMLTQFATVDEVMEGIKKVNVVGLDKEAVVHWRISDATGRQVVLEIVDGEMSFFDNKVGVITNSPGFQWHLTNLNNYVNLFPGDARECTMGDYTLRPIGGNSGFHGIPGDASPASRFVRAAFFRATAPQQENAWETVKQCFHLLNNFDIPIGIEHPMGKGPDIPSATQWTSVIDITHRMVYYKTSYNNTIRDIDVSKIDFTTVAYQYHSLDSSKEQPVEVIKIR
ncbi:MAG: choloylglycine hydrolase family protein [Prevotella sp.]|nr:choloylglycine hydrolase family protein [Prevotella sp.]